MRRRGFTSPQLEGLRGWIARETKLANPTLKEEAAATGDPDLVLAYAWSEAVNRKRSARSVKNVPPFPFVRESLEKMVEKADVMVVSATPGEALEREWEEHDLARHVGLIAGQELGSKKEHLALAASGRYEKTRVLMIGDAPGDQKAAEANGVLFYPIDPGREDESWRRFHDEALPRFFAGAYAGDYMAGADRRVRGAPARDSAVENGVKTLGHNRSIRRERFETPDHSTASSLEGTAPCPPVTSSSPSPAARLASSTTRSEASSSRAAATRRPSGRIFAGN